MSVMMKQYKQVLFNASLALIFVVIAYALYMVFLGVPNERQMGAVQRIFYFHVGCAVSCYFSMFLVLIGSVAYLATRKRLWDSMSEAAGEVGFVYATIVLLTGMVWGHSAWNTWFRWEPRLVTFLLLWLIFLAFIVLRIFGDPVRMAAHSAILGILGALMVPAVMLSIRLLPGMTQLHPSLQAKGGLAPEMKPALYIAMLGLILLQVLLVCLRTRIGSAERTLRDLQV